MAFGLANVLWPDDRPATFVCATTALVLCLVPAVATFLWTSWGMKQSPEQQLTAALGGTGVRLFVVLGIGLLLTTTVPYLEQHLEAFWLWVLGCYLTALALEIFLLVRAQHLDLANQQRQTAPPLPGGSE
jgi:hypothetical protein